ncbi:MAG TPA: tetratricopeptide repeat protein [Woeseiaceae bacterium]
MIQELRSRSVFRALMAYSVVSWMLLQVADVTFDRLPIPDGAMTALIVLVIIGFPITAILAWAYELTLDGIVRHEEVPDGAPRIAFAKYILIVLAVTAASGALMYYVSQEYWEPSRHSIAVLPFTNQSNEADTDYFSDGLTEEIRSLIVRLNEFRVVAMGTSYQLKENITDVATIAERLGAEVVLLGSVRKYQNKVTVTARLIDGKSGAELWSENYARELSDIYTIQEDIARRVARALHVVLPVSASRRLKNLGTRNVDAYDAYLRGLDYLRRPSDETSLLLAEGYLREALAIDPDFANAYAALCRKHLESYELSKDPERFGRAEESCQKALDINEESAVVHMALGDLYLASGKYENARAAFEEAIKDNGQLADVYIGLGNTDLAQGRNADAETNFRRAIETDVTYWASFNAMGNFLFKHGRFLEAAEFYTMYVNRTDDDADALNNLGAAYYLAGDFKKAAEAWDSSLTIKPTRNAYSNTGSMYYYIGDFDRAADRYAIAVNLAPNDYQLWGNLGDAYSFTDDKKSAAVISYKRAIELGEQKLEINSSDVDIISDLAYYYSRVGNRERAIAMDARARREAADNMYVHYNSALTNAGLGRTDEALTALERAVELEYEPELLRLDPVLAPLREEERFKRLASKESR